MRLTVARNWKSSSAKQVRIASAYSHIAGLWNASFAWQVCNRRLAKDYERKVQTSETLINVASIRLLL
jgi:hypothetical protein